MMNVAGEYYQNNARRFIYRLRYCQVWILYKLIHASNHYTSEEDLALVLKIIDNINKINSMSQYYIKYILRHNRFKKNKYHIR